MLRFRPAGLAALCDPRSRSPGGFLIRCPGSTDAGRPDRMHGRPAPDRWRRAPRTPGCCQDPRDARSEAGPLCAFGLSPAPPWSSCPPRRVEFPSGTTAQGAAPAAWLRVVPGAGPPGWRPLGSPFPCLSAGARCAAGKVLPRSQVPGVPAPYPVPSVPAPRVI